MAEDTATTEGKAIVCQPRNRRINAMGEFKVIASAKGFTDNEEECAM